jgi:hypothetical protein
MTEMHVKERSGEGSHSTLVVESNVAGERMRIVGEEQA